MQGVIHTNIDITPNTNHPERNIFNTLPITLLSLESVAEKLKDSNPWTKTMYTKLQFFGDSCLFAIKVLCFFDEGIQNY